MSGRRQINTFGSMERAVPRLSQLYIGDYYLCCSMSFLGAILNPPMFSVIRVSLTCFLDTIHRTSRSVVTAVRTLFNLCLTYPSDQEQKHFVEESRSAPGIYEVGFWVGEDGREGTVTTPFGRIVWVAGGQKREFWRIQPPTHINPARPVETFRSRKEGREGSVTKMIAWWSVARIVAIVEWPSGYSSDQWQHLETRHPGRPPASARVSWKRTAACTSPCRSLEETSSMHRQTLRIDLRSERTGRERRSSEAGELDWKSVARRAVPPPVLESLVTVKPAIWCWRRKKEVDCSLRPRSVTWSPLFDVEV
ncbi:hypothetical protein B0H14DRAFT_2560830 [Mycena olivaceomarginata]|nr:hypothetical protein B0H14DRAFT_2560830 [Mycena olivaceomarginata]